MASDLTSAPLTSEQQMNMFRLRDKMSLLNSEFLTVLNGFYSEKNHYDFTGTMKSYMEHVQKLKAMYKVDDDVAAAMGTVTAPAKQAPKRVEISSENTGNVSLRKIAKATRRNGSSSTASRATDSPKVTNSTVFAASSPATVASAPKFGDISVIAKETPAPLSKLAAPAAEPSAPVTARKRAIRGGGPLGGSESVIFKSGSEPQASTSSVQIPTTNIKFPEPSKDFWTKKDTSSGENASNNAGSLFAFLGKDNDKSKEPAKFTGFSFGKKPEADKETESKTDAPVEKSIFGVKKDAESSPLKPSIGSLFGSQKGADSNVKSQLGSLFGSPKDANSSPKAPQGSLFGSSSNTTGTTSPAKPLVFGESKEKNEDASTPKPFAALSFGASLFGSSTTKPPTSAAPTLSFGSGASGSSMFSGFAGLAQKAMDNQSKPDSGDQEEEGEYVPPKVETVEAEEPDAVFSSKVAAFKFNGKDYTKLGVGMLHVKNTDGKFSVLIRAATTTGTVWLNASCNKAMKATKADEKGDKIRLTCPTSMTEMTTMMIRFGTADGAKKFLDKVEEVTK